MSNPSFINKVHAAWTSVLVMYMSVKYAWGVGGGGWGEKGWLKGVNIIKECPELIKRKYSTA